MNAGPRPHARDFGALNLNSRSLALLACSALREKQGFDPVILDIRKLTAIADYFVLVHGNSQRHVRTLSDTTLEWLGAKKVEPGHVEGLNEARWVLLDYGSVIVHVFHRDTRAFYNLERLWGEAKTVRVTESISNEKRHPKARRSSPP